MKANCAVCGKEFTPYRATARVCGPQCRSERRRRYEDGRRERRSQECRERRANDPIWAERQREKHRRWREKVADDEEYLSEQKRRLRERYSNDPEYRRRVLDRQRQHYQPKPLVPCVCVVCGGSFEKVGSAKTTTCGPECRQSRRREAQRKYVAANPTRRRESAAAYREKNIDKCRAASISSRGKRADRYRAYGREYMSEKRAAQALGVPPLLYAAMKFTQTQEQSHAQD